MNTIKGIILLVVTALSLDAYGQDSSALTEDTFTFFLVEKVAEFPGGESEIYKFVSKNIRVPECGYECGGSAVINISFIIEKDGVLSNVQVASKRYSLIGPSQKEIKRNRKKGIPIMNCEACKKELEEESMRVIKSMPRWNPAKHKNKPVRMRFTLPIRYQLG